MEEGLTAFRLPTFRLASQAGRTRGANRFALDAERAVICVAAKKRLLLFHFDGKDFVELKELGLPDTVLDMAWCGDSICLGFKRECVVPAVFGFFSLFLLSRVVWGLLSRASVVCRPFFALGLGFLVPSLVLAFLCFF
jgi:CNH domain